MKKYIWYVFSIIIIAASITLTAIAPDAMSQVIIVCMTVLVLLSLWFGILPLIRYISAFDYAVDKIHEAVELKTDSPWTVIKDQDQFFKKPDLDNIFNDYKAKAQQQREMGIIISGIDDFINEDLIAVKCWQGVIHQIPSTLTGLGILGTFIGLIFGVKDLYFNDLEGAIVSIQNLLHGIDVAFYTSIAGVILSILFNILNRILWNVGIREMDMFTQEFKRLVIPSTDEQYSVRNKREVGEIISRLDRLPKNGQFLGEGGKADQAGASESILLPQIVNGLKNDEFTFVLQPRFDLNTRKTIGAEALLRWNHPKLGMVMPSVFMPTVERNGYITKLDKNIWDKVGQTIRSWIDSGRMVVPITVNISKTDILAMNVAEVFDETIKKYRIPPRYLEIDIAMNAYVETQSEAVETEEMFRQMGYKVSIDGFDGDFVKLSSVQDVKADVLKLNMKYFEETDINQLSAVISKVESLNFGIAAEGIESMEQLSVLRKSGCAEGQGYYLSKPLSIENFEEEVNNKR